jgi:hypothetical protein
MLICPAGESMLRLKADKDCGRGVEVEDEVVTPYPKAN